MREGITVEVSAVDRARLRAIVADRNSPQKHAWRAAIILATAEGCGTAEIMRRAGGSKPCVWRWQARFMAEGVAGLLRDKTRPPGTPPLPSATVRPTNSRLPSMPKRRDGQTTLALNLHRRHLNPDFPDGSAFCRRRASISGARSVTYDEPGG